jgi:hypothetical protein
VVGNLAAVLVHHDHMRVAFDPDIRKVDEFDTAPACLKAAA